MHLLSKHKFYASADKLLHEFFTVINKIDNEKVQLDGSLSDLVAFAIANQQQQATATSGQSDFENDGQQMHKAGSVEHNTEKSANLKRALIDANILPNTPAVVAAHEQTVKKTRLNDTIDNIQSRNNLTYDTEVLDDGSIIYICSKCKLVFLQTQSLYEHKCFQAFNDATSDTSMQLNNSTSNANVNDTSVYNPGNNDQSLIENLKNEISNLEKHGKENDLDEDYDNLKNSSDVIYME
jgi:hypothetical protein